MPESKKRYTKPELTDFFMPAGAAQILPLAACGNGSYADACNLGNSASGFPSCGNGSGATECGWGADAGSPNDCLSGTSAVD